MRLDREVVAHVEGLDREVLVDLVLEQAEGDWRLRERLAADARAASGSGLDRRGWRHRIEAAFAPYGDYVSYREAPGWAEEIREVLDELETLVTRFPQDVVALAEHAHGCADEAIQHVDDSDGWLTEFSHQLAEMHHRACRAAPPDPALLAVRLLDLETGTDLTGFEDAAVTYADVLGAEGVAAYRAEVRSRLEELPADDTSVGWRLERALAAVAIAAGDPDALIEAKAGRMHSPADHLEVATALRSAGRGEEAERWAADGLEAFRERHWQTGDLRTFLDGLLRARGADEEAAELYWDAFTAHASLSSYRAAVKAAGAGGPAVADRAVDRLESLVGAIRPSAPDGPARASAIGTVLTEIHLDEGRAAEAWAAATTHGCYSDQVWHALAEAVAASQPVDAIAVHRRLAMAEIDQKNKDGYRAAVRRLGRIKELAEGCGAPDRFTDVLTEVVTTHKAKRNLMAFLRERGWA